MLASLLSPLQCQHVCIAHIRRMANGYVIRFPCAAHYQGFNGATLGLTAKLQKPYVHSIGMNLSCLGE